MLNEVKHEEIAKEISTIQLVNYAIQFTLLYQLFMVAIAVVLSLLNFEPNSGVTIGALGGSIIWVSFKIVKNHARVLHKTEKIKLASFSFIGFLLSDFLMFIIKNSFLQNNSDILSLGDTEAIPFIVGISFLYYIVIYFFYGSFCKSCLKDLSTHDLKPKSNLSIKQKLQLLAKKFFFGLFWSILFLLLIAIILYSLNIDLERVKELSGRLFWGAILLGFGGSFMKLLPGTRDV